MYTKKLLLISFVITIFSCNSTSDHQPIVSAPDLIPSLSHAPAEYLPYGIPMPPKMVTEQGPEPYDSNIHSTVPNTMPEENLAHTLDIDIISRPRARRFTNGSLESPPPGTGDTGFRVTSWGIYAANDVQLDVELPPPDGDRVLLYAPTHLPQKESCIEATTVHRREAQWTSTGHAHGFWNWCSSTPGFEVFEGMVSQQWQDKYVRFYSPPGSSQGEDVFWVTIQAFSPGSDCWTGLLYNYLLGRWEVKLQSCGSSNIGLSQTNGWTMWESWWLLDGQCPGIPSISAKNLQQFDDFSTWQPINLTQHELFENDCFNTGSYIMTIHSSVSPGDWWHAHTPNP